MQINEKRSFEGDIDALGLGDPAAREGEIGIATPPLTALEFEIGEKEGPAFEAEIPVTPEPPKEKTDSVPAKRTAKEPEPIKEEFTIPDAFEVNERYNTQSFIETPANIRPTYLPRFTEVSDTYRMQDDPRPRPKPEKKTDILSDVELDATSDRIEEVEVERVLVTTSEHRADEPRDENMTVLKFSTPVIEEDDRTEPEVISAPKEQPPVEEISAEEVFEAPIGPSVIDIPAPVIKEEVRQEEPKAPVIEEAPRNTTVPDPDIPYHVVEFKNTNEYRETPPEGAVSPSEISLAYKGKEYNQPIERDAIKDRFLDTIMSIKVRIIGVFVLFAAMIAVDVLGFFGVNVFDMMGFGSVTSAKAFVDMQFSIALALLASPEIIRGFKQLISRRIVPELFISASLLAVMVSDILICTSTVREYKTFGVIFGVQVLTAIIAAYLKADADFTAFKMTSRNVPKNILDRKLTRELPHENHALDGAVDEYDSKTARMFRAAFVTDFYAHTSKDNENYANNGMILGVASGMALVTAVITFFLGSYSLVPAGETLALVFLLSVPSLSILIHKLPYRYASKCSEEEKGAFIGEGSLYDSSEIDVFTYEDTEIFGTEDVSILKVHLYGKAYNTAKAMKEMYSIFSVVGGPLDHVFSSALDRKCPSATDIIIEDDGISGSIEGHRISAGTEAYMQRHGIKIPGDDYRTNPTSTASTKVMYGAEDGEVYVKFFIRYSFSEEFTMLLPELKANKIVPLVYTRDPNITDELIKILTLGEDSMRVMKKYVPRASEEHTYRHASSGVVTLGDKTDLVNMVLVAKKYTRFQAKLAVLELVAMASGAVVAAVLSIAELISFPSSLFAVWQLLWSLGVLIASKRTLCHKEAADNDEE